MSEFYFLAQDEAMPIGPFKTEAEAELASMAHSFRVRDIFAMDKKSVRSYDADKRLHVAKANISKATVNPYYGREIPDHEKLGLDAEKIYKLYRHPDELKKAAASFNNLPLLNEHVPVDAQDHHPENVIGSLGTDAEYNHPYLQNSLVFWAKDAIDGVESEIKKELSSAYRYTADMTPGISPDGEAYDGIMRNIIGNHVAQVKEGRAGSDVVVGDAAIPSMKELFMVKPVVLSRKAQQVQGALAVALRPKLAKDAKIDLASVLSDVSGKNFKSKVPAICSSLKEVTKGKLAKDANLDDFHELLDSLGELEAVEGADADPETGLPMEQPAQDEEDEDEGKKKAREFLSSKMSAEDMKTYDEMCGMKPRGMDESPEEQKAREEKEAAAAAAKDAEMKKEDMVDKKAMDTAITAATKLATDNALKIARDIREAERNVRPWVGDIIIAEDSAEAVYRKAILAMDVKVDGLDKLPLAALKAVLNAQPLPGKSQNAGKEDLAMDAASGSDFLKRYPGAANIGNA